MARKNTSAAINNKWNNVEYDSAPIKMSIDQDDLIDDTFVEGNVDDKIINMIDIMATEKQYDVYNIQTEFGLTNVMAPATMYDIFTYMFMPIYNQYQNPAKIVTSFCDYYTIDYAKLWKNAPAGIKILVMDDLKQYFRLSERNMIADKNGNVPLF